ncbi:MAG: hypothetical protein KJ621_04900 [Proteobacteria bacterium]|nr:hypothetical protein [Pseudomonadota bacterium]MBU1741693.1 hypothetical protein [Pseudomonadota bacterium]
MVKISQTPGPEQTQAPSRQGRTAPTDFKSVFQSAVTHGPGAAAVPPAVPTAPAGGAPPVGSDLSRVERVVDLLDRYQEVLADPRIPLKKVGDLVDNLDREADWLAIRAAQISGPPALRNLLNQTALTAKIEALKYTRGDYV